MDVTIVICTFNRHRLLEKTLAQFKQLDAGCCTDWEIIVVNNNCSDDTDAVIERYSRDLPLRRLFEPRPGKSHAANRAIREARGDLILWADDDVLVEPGWLRAYVRAADSCPHAQFFGGSITPWYEVEPPRWMAEHLDLISGCFAIRDAPEGPFAPVQAEYLPFGANMATRRGCFEHAVFDVRLGPQGNTQIRGEEIALLETFLRKGLHGAWVGDARVRHFIPRARITTRYVWDFFRGVGRTRVRRGEIARANELLGVPRWVWRRYAQRLCECMLYWRLHVPRRWVASFISAAALRGIIKEARARAGSRHGPEPTAPFLQEAASSM